MTTLRHRNTHVIKKHVILTYETIKSSFKQILTTTLKVNAKQNRKAGSQA